MSVCTRLCELVCGLVLYLLHSAADAGNPSQVRSQPRYAESGRLLYHQRMVHTVGYYCYTALPAHGAHLAVVHALLRPAAEVVPEGAVADHDDYLLGAGGQPAGQLRGALLQ